MDTLVELNTFYEKITLYKKLINEYINTFFPSDAIKTRIQDLRTELQRSHSRLERVIIRYGGSSLVSDPVSGVMQNVFDVAFDTIYPQDYGKNLKALDKVIKIVNKAIGKLQVEGESWNVPTENIRDKVKKSKVFISHSGMTDALSKLCDFLKTLGIDELLVIKQPNLGRSIDKKVEDYVNEADLAIFIATGDATDKQGETIPSGNVLHEIGLAQAKPKLEGKIIYLLEEGASFPSNIKPKGYIRFNSSHIESVYKDIVNEIKGMGLIVTE